MLGTTAPLVSCDNHAMNGTEMVVAYDMWLSSVVAATTKSAHACCE